MVFIMKFIIMGTSRTNNTQKTEHGKRRKSQLKTLKRLEQNNIVLKELAKNR